MVVVLTSERRLWLVCCCVVVVILGTSGTGSVPASWPRSRMKELRGEDREGRRCWSAGLSSPLPAPANDTTLLDDDRGWTIDEATTRYLARQEITTMRGKRRRTTR